MCLCDRLGANTAHNMLSEASLPQHNLMRLRRAVGGLRARGALGFSKGLHRARAAKEVADLAETCPELKEQMRESHAIAPLVELVKSGGTDDERAWAACALGALSSDTEDNQTAVRNEV